jgi:hypothetical protein
LDVQATEVIDFSNEALYGPPRPLIIRGASTREACIITAKAGIFALQITGSSTNVVQLSNLTINVDFGTALSAKTSSLALDRVTLTRKPNTLASFPFMIASAPSVSITNSIISSGLPGELKTTTTATITNTLFENGSNLNIYRSGSAGLLLIDTCQQVSVSNSTFRDATAWLGGT